MMRFLMLAATLLVCGCGGSDLRSTLSASTAFTMVSVAPSPRAACASSEVDLVLKSVMAFEAAMNSSSTPTARQIAAFNALIQASLSAAGYTTDADSYGADLYHVAFVGTPSATGLWTVMVRGDHMGFNVTFYEGCVYPTPHHIGVEPRTSLTASTETRYNFYSPGLTE